ncbi:MAG TPA: PQQ-dependent sugar dehydrogenase [Gemmatimonadaceae bacterium]|jgi:glucose/arabinose dehydrogenase
MRHNYPMLLLSLVTLACAARPQGPAPHSTQPKSIDGGVRAETVASGLEHPWGLAILPDKRMLVTERPGRLRIVSQAGQLSAPLTGVPAVFAQGQGGLLDVALDPAFAKNHVIYLSYAEPGAGRTAGTAVARARLNDAGLDSVRVIYQQQPKVTGGNHFGSRIVFRGDGTMFVTQGERFDYRDQAQDLNSLLGKVVRINTDGSVPKDNPFVGRSDARPEIWSYGHRNMQGAAIEPATGRFWTIEHGAAGGDELNHPEPGKNYGWPVITYGRDYNGRSIGIGAVKEGMEQPVFYWDPVIAPSGMTFYTGNAFPAWKGNMFVGSMNPGALVRLVIRNGEVALEERYLGDLHERIRDVQEGADGFLYLLTDSSNGRVLRVLPK